MRAPGIREIVRSAATVPLVLLLVGWSYTLNFFTLSEHQDNRDGVFESLYQSSLSISKTKPCTCLSLWVAS